MESESRWHDAEWLPSAAVASIGDDTPETTGSLPTENGRPMLNGVFAVVGCDGSGKTRLAADLAAHLNRHRPAQRRYMGLISGETGDRIRRLPIIGPRLERHLAARVRRAQDMNRKLPGTFSAIIMYFFSLWRVSKVRKLMRLSTGGVLVIAERYPQQEIPGFHYDGPGLAADRTSNRLVQRLARHEQRLYQWMAGQRPNFVIRLLVDLDTAYTRKSDHPRAELRDKIDMMARLTFGGAVIYEIDSRMPYQQVFDTALRLIEAALA